MLERHDAHSGRQNDGLNPEHRKVRNIRPLADREVPLTGAASMSISEVPAEVHQWLDGELSERIARHADRHSNTRNVELWNRISEETTRRRRLKTPSQLTKNVMAVLPSKAPSRFDLLFRPFRMTPAVATAIGAGLLAAGACVGRLLLR